MPARPYITLNTGARLPSIGLGTWQSPPGAVQTAVHDALEAGYRHIDCAFGYGNEAEVGAGIASFLASHPTVTRSDLFVTTKLWATWHSRAPAALDESLRRLGLEYVDLYLMHWPVPLNPRGNDPNFPTKADGERDIEEGWNYVKTWKEMEGLTKSGKTRAIGVSNCSVRYLKELLKYAEVVPAVDQVESHPLLPGNDLVGFCREMGIVVTAYSPLGSTGGPLLRDETVAGVAKRKGCKVGNVLLNYHVNRGVVAVAKSVAKERIVENGKLVDLDEEDMKVLENLHKEKGYKRFITPAWPVDFLFQEANWNSAYKPLIPVQM